MSSRLLHVLRTMAPVTKSPYGSWKSPISSSLLVDKTARITSVLIDRGSKSNHQQVFWTELRPNEKGRVVLCSKIFGEESHQEWTPQEHNTRTRVHEYGGGAALIHDGVAYVSNFSDNSLYSLAAPGMATRISPEKHTLRYADGVVDEKRNRYISVCEDHTENGANNCITSASLKDHQHQVLVSGADFYSAPRISPDGKRLCWIEWDHPNMPWDTTSLWMAELNDDGSLVEASKKKVAGGHEESVVYPSWSPDGVLTFISDRSNWWNLYQLNEKQEALPVFPKPSEFCGPHWEFGNTPYAFVPESSQILINFSENGKGQLGLVDSKTQTFKKLETGFLSHSYLSVTKTGRAVFLALDPKKPSVVVSIDLKTEASTIEKTSAQNLLDEGYFSFPRQIEFPTNNNLTAFAYFYPPRNKDFEALDNEKPPLLVRAHGGPTASCSVAFNLAIQYWTSRGFGFLDVNYGGSTGYGRSYRERLKGRWGIVDVDDCCNAALYLANVTNEVDGNRLAIDGGSAGGYTTLSVLTFRNVFKAGCSNYGVSDLEALALDTHKFESRYLDSLIGPYPAEKELYHLRSPLHHVDRLSCPIIFFHGDEDKVVPPNQAEVMFKKLKEKGLPVAFILFEGEQHGFRKAENIRENVDGEFLFFSKVFGFQPADELKLGFKIENLE